MLSNVKFANEHSCQNSILIHIYINLLLNLFVRQLFISSKRIKTRVNNCDSDIIILDLFKNVFIERNVAIGIKIRLDDDDLSFGASSKLVRIVLDYIFFDFLHFAEGSRH